MKPLILRDRNIKCMYNRGSKNNLKYLNILLKKFSACFGHVFYYYVKLFIYNLY